MWDVLVLSRDLFDISPGDVAVMERLLAPPPGKFLELRTDKFLTDYFRAGGVYQVEKHRTNKNASNKGTWAFQL